MMFDYSQSTQDVRQPNNFLGVLYRQHDTHRPAFQDSHQLTAWCVCVQMSSQCIAWPLRAACSQRCLWTSKTPVWPGYPESRLCPGHTTYKI